MAKKYIIENRNHKHLRPQKPTAAKLFTKPPVVACGDTSQQQIDAYLVFVLQRTQGKSVTTYKQTVYAIMYYYKHVAKIPCPTLPRVVQHYGLPVVLSKAECMRLFKAPTYLKHRIVLSLIYSGGLRISEAVNLKLQDIDFDRKTIIIRDGKGLKDRCVALSDLIAKGIQKYLLEFKPITWLFNAHTKGKQYSTRSIQSVMQQAIAKAAIDKDASVHSLRHSYATHLLEDGVNIITVQALMGHSKLETTMIYLQLLSKNTQVVKSPLDTLYNL